MPVQKRSVVELCLFLVAVIWALNFSVIKDSLTVFDPHSFNGLRFVFAGGVIWVVFLAQKQKLHIPGKDWLPLLGMGILGNLVYQGLFIIGIDYTQAANAAVMLGTIPVWVALLANFFSIEKLTLPKTAGVVCAFAGILCIVTGGKAGFSLSSDTFLGDMAILASAIVWAAFTILSRSFLNRYTPIQFTTIITTIGAIILFLAGLPGLMELQWETVTSRAIGGVLYSGVLSIGMAYLIWNYGIQTVGPVRSSTYQNLVPVLGLLFGVMLLQEELSLLQYMGSAFVIAGIILARLKLNSRSAA